MARDLCLKTKTVMSMKAPTRMPSTTPIETATIRPPANTHTHTHTHDLDLMSMSMSILDLYRMGQKVSC